MSFTPTLNILIGVAGAGKSTVVDQIEENWRHKIFDIICPDNIREEFCDGDRADQSKNAEVWAEAYDRLEFSMAKKRADVIFDSTMLTPKSRKKLISMGKEHGYYIVAHVVKRDLNVILKQNAGRKWKVPEHIVETMFERMTEPVHEEGFNRIMFYYNESKNNG